MNQRGFFTLIYAVIKLHSGSISIISQLFLFTFFYGRPLSLTACFKTSPLDIFLVRSQAFFPFFWYRIEVPPSTPPSGRRIGNNLVEGNSIYNSQEYASYRRKSRSGFTGLSLLSFPLFLSHRGVIPQSTCCIHCGRPRWTLGNAMFVLWVQLICNLGSGMIPVMELHNVALDLPSKITKKKHPFSRCTPLPGEQKYSSTSEPLFVLGGSITPLDPWSGSWNSCQSRNVSYRGNDHSG